MTLRMDPIEEICVFCRQSIVLTVAGAFARHYEQPRRADQAPCDASGLRPREAEIVHRRIYS